MAYEEDSLIKTAMVMANGGFDHDLAGGVIRPALEALKEQSELLLEETRHLKEKQKGNRDITIEQIGRAIKATSAMVDELTRLMAFVDGKPDSRMEIAGSDILAGLTEDQINQVQIWLTENEVKSQQG